MSEKELVHRENVIVEQRASFSELQEWRKTRRLLAFAVVFLIIVVALAFIGGLIAYQKTANVLTVLYTHLGKC